MLLWIYHPRIYLNSITGANNIVISDGSPGIEGSKDVSRTISDEPTKEKIYIY